MSAFKSVKSGIISGQFTKLIVLFIGFFVTPYIIHKLGQEQFAIFSLIYSFMYMLTILQVGNIATTTSLIAREQNNDKVNTIFNNALLIQFIVVVAVTSIGLAARNYFPRFIGVSQEHLLQASTLYLLSIGGIAFTIAGNTFNGILFAKGYQLIVNNLQTFSSILNSAIIVVCIYFGYGLISLGIAWFSSTGLNLILKIIYVKLTLKGVNFQLKYLSWSFIKNNYSGISFWFSVGNISQLVLYKLDHYIAAKIVTLEIVTALVITNRLYSIASSFVKPITDNLRPSLGNSLGKGDYQSAFKKFYYLIYISNGATIVFICSIFVMNQEFIAWWVSEQQVYASIPIDLLIGLNLFFYNWLLPFKAPLTADLIVKPVVLNRLIEAGINLSLSIFLGYKFGAAGIIGATSFSCLVTSCWYIPKLTKKVFMEQPNYSSFVLKFAIRCFSFLILAYSSSYIFKIGLQPDIPFFFLIKGACLGLLLVFCCYFFFFPKDVRAFMHQKFLEPILKRF